MLRRQYFDWLVSHISLDGYYILLSKLFDTEFVWSVPFDANRADDGVHLRYRFGRECGIPDPVICGEIDTVPCSILEMMIALALRNEEQIMGDESVGDRTGLWVREMLDNLGLLAYPDSRYDPFAVDDIIYIFLNRQYSRTGKGGLFEVPNLDPSRDMRTAELWCQMNWYMKKQAERRV